MYNANKIYFNFYRVTKKLKLSGWFPGIHNIYLNLIYVGIVVCNLAIYAIWHTSCYLFSL